VQSTQAAEAPSQFDQEALQERQSRGSRQVRGQDGGPSFSQAQEEGPQEVIMKLLIQRYDSLFYGRVIDNLLSKGFARLGQGSFRVTFGRGKVVVKVPYNQNGFEDNLTEAFNWRKYRDKPNLNGYLFAPCRLLPDATLMMVHVDTKVFHEELPHWTRYIDGQQVGRYKGKLVAYDYACDAGHQLDAKCTYLL